MNRQSADNEDRKKTYMILRKKSAEQRKILLIFGGSYGKKQLKKALFLRFFEEILMPIKAIIKRVSFSTNPGVSLKNLKKVSKKVLT